MDITILIIGIGVFFAIISIACGILMAKTENEIIHSIERIQNEIKIIKENNIRVEDNSRKDTRKITEELGLRIKKLENPPKFKIGDTVLVNGSSGQLVASVITNTWYCEWTEKNMYCCRRDEHYILDIDESSVFPYLEVTKNQADNKTQKKK
jgi:hypothetical protein